MSLAIAYRHILSVFQTIPSDDLPFSEYLVDVSQNVRLPHYAAVKRHYDIAMHPAGKRRMSDKAKPVDITKIWPRYEIGMDSTQMDALKTILSNNVAIVQGKLWGYRLRVISLSLNKVYRSTWYW